MKTNESNKWVRAAPVFNTSGYWKTHPWVQLFEMLSKQELTTGRQIGGYSNTQIYNSDLTVNMHSLAKHQHKRTMPLPHVWSAQCSEYQRKKQQATDEQSGSASQWRWRLGWNSGSASQWRWRLGWQRRVHQQLKITRLLVNKYTFIYL